MKITYHLSNRQKKECAERDTMLSIAIPLADDAPEDTDPLTYAREMLDVPRDWVFSAEILELPIRAPLGCGSGLTGLWGEIAHRGIRPDTLIYRVVCVVASVSARHVSRHGARTQWPGSVTIEGKTFPSPE